MATNNRGADRQGNRGRNNRDNNPEGRNQYSGLTGAARANPLAAAAAVGSAVAAGVFLWSRRSQISEQIEDLSFQVREWRSGSDFTGENLSSDEPFMARSSSRKRSQAEIAEEALTLKETGHAS